MPQPLTRREVCTLALGLLPDARPPSVLTLRPEQTDAHLHSGKEREIPIAEWVDLAAARGRRALVLLDHLELYRPGQPPRRNYPEGRTGRVAFLNDVARQKQRRNDLLIYSGWEVFEGELDTGLEMDALAEVDTLGWHISHYRTQRLPDGAVLLQRAGQLLDLQKRLRIPMVLFHPFELRFEGLQRRQEPLNRETCRYFRGDEQKRLADLVAGTEVFVEINASYLKEYWQHPITREALIEAIRPLAESGVGFTVGSDAHTLRDLREDPYAVGPVLEACGVRADQIRRYWELLNARGKPR